MHTIHKYPVNVRAALETIGTDLSGHLEIDMAEDAKILSFQVQSHAGAMLWAEVPLPEKAEDYAEETRHFRLRGTGWKYTKGDSEKHIGKVVSSLPSTKAK